MFLFCFCWVSTDLLPLARTRGCRINVKVGRQTDLKYYCCSCVGFVYKCICHLNGRSIIFNLPCKRKPVSNSVHFLAFQFVSFWRWSCRRLWRKPAAPKKSWRLEKCWIQERGGERSNTTPRKWKKISNDAFFVDGTPFMIESVAQKGRWSSLPIR